MANYTVALQRTKSKKTCVCLLSLDNGKLVLKGEPINRVTDASALAWRLIAAFGDGQEQLDCYPWNYRWTKNSGPKKSKPVTKKKK